MSRNFLNIKPYFFLLGLALLLTNAHAQTNDHVNHSLKKAKKAGNQFEKGNYNRSIKLYTKAINAYPELEYNYYHRGLAYKELGDSENAFTDFDKGILFNTNSKECYYERGLIYLARKDYKNAIKDFENHLIVMPEDEPALEQLILAFTESGLNLDALRIAEQLFRLNSNSIIALQTKLAHALNIKNSELIEATFTQLDATGNNSVKTKLLRAEYFLFNKEPDLSISILQKIVRNILAIPHHAEAFYLLANSFSAKHEKDNALDFLSKAILLSPKIAYYYDRGCLAAEIGLTKLALLDFSTVLLLDSTHKGAYNNRTFYIWFPQKKYHEAVNDLNKIIELDSTNAFAYSNRSYAYYGLKNYDRGLTDGLTAVELEPKNPYAYKNLALLYFAKGLEDDAIEMAKGAIYWKFPLETDSEFVLLLDELELDY